MQISDVCRTYRRERNPRRNRAFYATPAPHRNLKENSWLVMVENSPKDVENLPYFLP
jgi:hypothetical protein